MGFKLRSKQPRHEFRAPRRQQEPERATTPREEHALRQQLTGDPGAAGANRHPDRDFARPRRRAHQQQIRDICAGDQQHDGHHPHQHAERCE